MHGSPLPSMRSNRVPYPEVRGSHLAGEIERERARLERKRQRKARRKAKRAKQHDRRPETAMLQQPLPSQVKQRKPRQVKHQYLSAAVTEALVQRIVAPGGKADVAKVYKQHAPSKVESQAANSAINTLLRRHQKKLPYSMSRETHRIWMAIYLGSVPPASPPLPATQSAPAPAQTALVDPRSLRDTIREMLREEFAAAQTAGPSAEQIRVEVKSLVEQAAKARNGSYKACWLWLYANCPFAPPDGPREDSSLLSRIIISGHGVELLEVARDLFGKA